VIVGGIGRSDIGLHGPRRRYRHQNAPGHPHQGDGPPTSPARLCYLFRAHPDHHPCQVESRNIRSLTTIRLRSPRDLTDDTVATKERTSKFRGDQIGRRERSFGSPLERDPGRSLNPLKTRSICPMCRYELSITCGDGPGAASASRRCRGNHKRRDQARSVRSGSDQHRCDAGRALVHFHTSTGPTAIFWFDPFFRPEGGRWFFRGYACYRDRKE
jgi:hypothetical protein